MTRLGFGIVGTGMIAGVVADAIGKAANARLVAASGREIGTAQKFVAERAGVAAVQGFEALVGRADVDAVYVATPTTPKEEVTLAAIAAGKHVLVDKPFADRASLLRMTDAATQRESRSWMRRISCITRARKRFARLQRSGLERRDRCKRCFIFR